MPETKTKRQLQEMIDGDLNRHNYSELVSEIYDSFRNIDRAHQILSDIEAKVDSGKKTQPELFEKAGIFAYAQGEYQKAFKLLEPVKDRSEASHFFGRVLAKLHHFEEALEAMENGREDGDDFQTDRFIIEVLCVLRRDERAAKLCEKHQKAHSESPDWLYCKGRTLETAGQYGQAMECYEKALAKDEEHLNSLFRLAYNCDLNGEDERAIELYNRCADLQPTSLGGLMNLGVLYEDREEYEKAIECYEKVLAVDPAHKRARLYLKDADESLHMAIDSDLGITLPPKEQTLQIPITNFDLSVRSQKVLNTLEVETLGDLTNITGEELLSFDNFGQSSLQEIKDLLDEYGKSLKESPAQIAESDEENNEM